MRVAAKLSATCLGMPGCNESERRAQEGWQW